MIKLDEYELISDVGSKDFTDFITDEIHFKWNWIFPNDEYLYDNHIRDEEKDRTISDTGAMIKSFVDTRSHEDNNNYFRLNNYADYLYKSILRKSKWEYTSPQLRRYYWNYYNVGSSGYFHTDYGIGDKGTIDKNGDTIPHASILYNFSDDGSTIINSREEIEISSVSGDAIIFNSFAKHRGVGPSKSKKRFALNIVFTYSKRTLR